MDGIVLRHNLTHNGVSSFVVGGILLFFLAHNHGSTLGAHHDFVAGLFELFHCYQAFVAPGRKQCGFVDQVGQVGTRETRGTAGNNHGLNALVDGHLAHMDFQYLLAATNIRQADHHLAVKTARTEQRLVQHVGAVGSGNDDYALVALKTIHFHQQLVERLLTLIVATTVAAAAMATNGVNFVNKDDARCLFFGLIEHIPHSGGAHTDKHLHKVRARDGEKWHFGFPGDGFGQQGFTGTRSTRHQHAARDSAAELLKFTGVAQKLHQLLHLFLGLIHTGHISKGGFDLVFTQQTRFALAKAHGTTLATHAATLHLAHKEHQHGNDDKNGEAGYEQLLPEAGGFGQFAFHSHSVVEQIGHKPIVAHLWANGAKTTAVTQRALDFQPFNRDFSNSLVLNCFDKFRIAEGFTRCRLLKALKNGEKNCGNDQPQDEVLGHVVQKNTLMSRRLAQASGKL